VEEESGMVGENRRESRRTCGEKTGETKKEGIGSKKNLAQNI
jgi:hypothetical protein